MSTIVAIEVRLVGCAEQTKKDSRRFLLVKPLPCKYFCCAFVVAYKAKVFIVKIIAIKTFLLPQLEFCR